MDDAAKPLKTNKAAPTAMKAVVQAPKSAIQAPKSIVEATKPAAKNVVKPPFMAAQAAPIKPPVAPAPKPPIKKPVASVALAAPVPAAAAPAPVVKHSIVDAPVVAAAPDVEPATVAPPAPVVEPVAAIEPAPVSIAPQGAPIAAKDVIMDTISTFTDKAQAMFSTDHAKGAMEKSQKMFDEMNSFSKGNIEALVESSKIAAKGIETLGQDAAAYAKKSFEEASAAVKTMASVKSPTELMKLQSDYVRSAFDMMVAETSRSTEAMLKLAGEVAQPISNRVAIAAEKVKIAA